MERKFTNWLVNGKEEELSITVAALLALEDNGLCVVSLAMKADDPAKGFVLMPGQAAKALAIGMRQRALEAGDKRLPKLETLQAEILGAARKLPAGTTLLARDGTGYLAAIQRDMGEATEAEDVPEGPKA